MTRNMLLATASAAGVAAIAAAAAIASGKAFADDITIDKTPFVSSRSRVEVQAELMRSSVNEWTRQFNDPQRRTGAITRQQATAEYLAARDETRALNAEDSGSAYFGRRPGGANARAMGASGR